MVFGTQYNYLDSVNADTISGTILDAADSYIDTLSGTLYDDLDNKSPANHTHPNLNKYVVSYISTISGLDPEDYAIYWDTEIVRDASVFTMTSGGDHIYVSLSGIYEIGYEINLENTNPYEVNSEFFVYVNDINTITYSKSYGYSYSSDFPYLQHSKIFTRYMNGGDYFGFRTIVSGTSFDPLWYDSDYLHRTSIVIDHTKVSTGPHTDFPMWVYLTGLTNVSHANGYDIIFTDYSGNLLYHELVSFSSGTLYAWVKVTSVSSATDTIVVMYYDNDSISADQSNTAQVWSDYTAVWHLQESGNGTADEFEDITGNGWDGQGTSAPTRIAGHVQPYSQDFNGSTNEIYLGTTAIESFLGTFTLSAWVNADSNGGVDNHTAIYSRRASDDTEPGQAELCWGEYAPANNNLLFVTNDSGVFSDHVGSSLSLDTWYYLVVTVYAGPEINMHINGVEDTSTTYDPPNNVAGLEQYIGYMESVTNGYFDGSIEEVRLSTNELSEGWLITEFNNQNSPGTFYTTQDEEDYSASAVGGLPAGVNLIPGEISFYCKFIK